MHTVMLSTILIANVLTRAVATTPTCARLVNPSRFAEKQFEAHFAGRLETECFIQGTALFAGVQIDPLKALFATPGNDRLSKPACDATAAKRGLDVHAVNPGTSQRWLQPTWNPLHDFEGSTAARFSNPEMPSALGNGGAKIRF
jgi:hypothetical protein